MPPRRARLAAVPVLAVALAACTATGDALAQAAPFGVIPREPAMTPGSGPLSDLFAWIAVQQSAIYRTLSGLVAEFRTNPSAGWILAGLSFAYGVLHAAGPGHGKVVITSYLVATGETLRRGIMLSFAAALVQAATAIALVGVMAAVLHTTGAAMTHATMTVEIASYALVTVIGAWLVWRKARAFAAPLAVLAPAGHSRVHAHDHADGCGCGHGHAPDPAHLAGPLSLRQAGAAVAAVGLRPCTGAILVLVFALSQGVFLLGIGSPLAMAAGTGATVAALAGLAVGARGVAARLAAGNPGWASGLVHAIELLAALLVLAFGLLLLAGALSGQSALRPA